MTEESTSTPDVIVYGTVCLDVLIRVGADREPIAAEQEFPGGEAFNTATALAGWGVNVLLTGTGIGYDPEGHRLRDLLDHHPLGLARAFIPNVASAVTPVCWVKVTSDGERYMTGRGFKEVVAPAPLPDSILNPRPVFATDPNLGQPAVTEALRAAAFGCPVVAMDLSHRPEIVAISRVVIESQERIRHLGLTASPEALAAGWVEQGAQTGIVTLGPAGCVVADRDTGIFAVPAFAVSPVVDTTGAGDTFRAGICYGLHNGLGLREMVRFACAAAACHCQVLGGGSRIPLATVLSLL